MPGTYKNRSTYPTDDLTEFSPSFTLTPLLRKILLGEYFVPRCSTVLRDVRSETTPLPTIVLNFHFRWKYFLEKVGRRTETDISGSTSVPFEHGYTRKGKFVH